PAQQAIEVWIVAQPLHAQVLASQVHRLVVLNREAVVVDAPVSKTELCRRTHIASAQQLALRRLAAFGGLLSHDDLQTLGSGLDRTLVDIAADPAATEPLRDGSSGAGTDETVKHDVARPRRC